MAELNIAGFDIETTGLNQAEGHRIVEVALILYGFDSETLEHKAKGKFVQRINPQRPIDPEAQRVHGITFDDVAACPVWEEVAPKLVKVLRACHGVVAHNGEKFDVPFLRGELTRIGLAMPRIELVDTMVSGRWATPLGKLPSLKELCFAVGVQYDPEKAHAAEYDVIVMMDSYFRAAKQGFFRIPTVEMA